MTAKRWSYRPQANLPATMVMAWLLPFAGISLYWGLGGMWLVDTAVQDRGVELARARPTWIVALVLATALFKLGWIAWAYLIVAPVGRYIPRCLYLLFGISVGTGSLLYGLVPAIQALPRVWAGPISVRGWWHLVVWWPQFWVAGLLTLVATAVFNRPRSAGGRSRRCEAFPGARRGAP